MAGLLDWYTQDDPRIAQMLAAIEQDRVSSENMQGNLAGQFGAEALQFGDLGTSPGYQPFMQQGGYRLAKRGDDKGEGPLYNNAIIGPDGQPVPGSEWSSHTSDADFMRQALLMMAGAGAGAYMQGAGMASSQAGTLAPIADAGTFTFPAISDAGMGALGVAGTSPGTLGTLGQVAGGVGTLGTIAAGSAPVDALALMGTEVAPAIYGSTLPQTVGAVAGGVGLAGMLGDAAPYVKAALPILGAIGGAQGQPGSDATTQHRTDPRFDPYLYGGNGLLGAAQQTFNATRGGNEAQRAGWARQLGLLSDPRISGQLGSMRDAGAGLMGGGVAGNPFMQEGGSSLTRPPVFQQPVPGDLGGGRVMNPTIPPRGWSG